jgi:phosphoribosylglycinamide formyltransferase 2
MQVADARETIDMLDGAAVARTIRRHRPDFVVPEIEAIRTEKLVELERKGLSVVPSAEAAYLTMNRDAIRDLAARELRVPTARYAYATSEAALLDAVVADGGIGLPCVVKPVMSSSGKGQSVVRRRGELAKAWRSAVEGMRGDRAKVIVEAFVEFEVEITLLTVKQRRRVLGKPGKTLFCPPIGHRQEQGDYRESWMPCPISAPALRRAQAMARKVVERIAGPDGAGIFGVEFFIRGDEAIFSELSPRPHDTGMVTMAGLELSEFDLHVRAILGLPIPRIRALGPAASSVVLAEFESRHAPRYEGVDRALAAAGVEVRLFGKPSTRKGRRMGVVLAQGRTIAEARRTANTAAKAIRVRPAR